MAGTEHTPTGMGLVRGNELHILQLSGAGNNPTVRELATISEVWSQRLLFLCETRQSNNKMRRLHHRLGLGGFTGFNSDGLSGGLALFWHDQIIVEVQEVNGRYIDVYVRESLSVLQWGLTCVYGEPRVENRHRKWDKIRNLKSTSNLPMLVVGDFNEALWQEEHLSNNPRSVI
jgi:hypothetical protein